MVANDHKVVRVRRRNRDSESKLNRNSIETWLKLMRNVVESDVKRGRNVVESDVNSTLISCKINELTEKRVNPNSHIGVNVEIEKERKNQRCKIRR